MAEPKTRHPFVPPPTGLEGREEEFGHAMAALVKTFGDSGPYQHQFNDALVKSYLAHLEFAIKHNLVEEAQQHQVETLMPVLKRVGKLVASTGDKELGLVGMFERTTCVYQLVEHLESSEGVRRFPCPYSRVLEQGKRIGQFSFEIEDVHRLWCEPVWKGYAKEVGIEIEVAECHGAYTQVRLAETATADAGAGVKEPATVA